MILTLASTDERQPVPPQRLFGKVLVSGVMLPKLALQLAGFGHQLIAK